MAGIPACILVLDKENAHARKGIFMIDASKGFIKDGNKNRLRAQDIHRIVDTFARQLELARLLPGRELEKNWAVETIISELNRPLDNRRPPPVTAPNGRRPPS